MPQRWRIRNDFKETLWAVARFDAYAQVTKGKLTSMGLNARPDDCKGAEVLCSESLPNGAFRAVVTEEMEQCASDPDVS